MENAYEYLTTAVDECMKRIKAAGCGAGNQSLLDFHGFLNNLRGTLISKILTTMKWHTIDYGEIFDHRTDKILDSKKHLLPKENRYILVYYNLNGDNETRVDHLELVHWGKDDFWLTCYPDRKRRVGDRECFQWAYVRHPWEDRELKVETSRPFVTVTGG